MGKTSNAAKQRWCKENLTQIKIAISPEIASAFKARCKAEGVSMAGEISRFMSGQCRESMPKGKQAFQVETRQQRRRALARLIPEVEAIKDAESGYMSRIPANLEGSIRYEEADQSVSALEDALDSLNEVYS